MKSVPQSTDRLVMARGGLDQLFDALVRRGFRLVGPTVRDGAIVYDEIAASADLPAGWTDQQDGGRYRLERRDDEALFGYAVGPQSWKRFLHPPSSALWQRAARRRALPPSARSPKRPPRFAFIGVRACELHAIAIQDRVFMGGAHVDPAYAARRRRRFHRRGELRRRPAAPASASR